MQTGQQHGMQTMDGALADLAKKGLIDRPAPTATSAGGGLAAAGGSH